MPVFDGTPPRRERADADIRTAVSVGDDTGLVPSAVSGDGGGLVRDGVAWRDGLLPAAIGGGPIRGLYLAGGSVHPGPGVPMAALSGKIAAERLMADRALIGRSRPVAITGGMSMRSAIADSSR